MLSDYKFSSATVGSYNQQYIYTGSTYQIFQDEYDIRLKLKKKNIHTCTYLYTSISGPNIIYSKSPQQNMKT